MRHIPPEIWGIIIQHACVFDHDPLDTSQDPSFLQSKPTLPTTYRAEMNIKLALSLVSKQWNSLTRPFLYEFIWIGRAMHAKLLSRTLLMEFVNCSGSSGKYLRRLHIETPALERCSPADLRTILDYAPHLFIFADQRSVQRSLIDAVSDPKCGPEEILQLVAHPKVRRLSWTRYDDAPFQLVMAPLENNIATHLEYLELFSWLPQCDALFAEPLGRGDGASIEMNVQLPSLRALKIALDDDALAVLASWRMPSLTHVSVLSGDFNCPGAGFARFFRAHGGRLRQLELGHSPTRASELYLTPPPQYTRIPPTPPPLATWCPNLREFICSADAEWHWHWQAPDWIAPHVLLPSHPTVELIAIRDIDIRLRDDPHVFEGGETAGGAYFLLCEQMSVLLRRDAFPNLRFVRDVSAESHLMRTIRPAERVTQFWTTVLRRCQERGIWMEDYHGVNIALRNLRQASLGQNETPE
ncbi:uncharacterized protein FIBRA_05155 [Fibroporia radiculosa]|uniref:F-box domain-containing protein n=1 Tax=Fibroporia radiculosa TaxID=599839 RepID=J4G8N9_9APHY|nr:uncharacterized protein FIBRA_05155 [Fibroporia radiculosa]CCM03038.1 predicted protein [Fibroporia radiculosa]